MLQRDMTQFLGPFEQMYFGVSRKVCLVPVLKSITVDGDLF